VVREPGVSDTDSSAVTDSTLTPAAFVQKWRRVTTTEKASLQSHFIDLGDELAPDSVAAMNSPRLAELN
jgi:hypothetical protein